MTRPDLSGLKDTFITVDGIRTHFVEAGAGPAVVLLHSGEFGACAEASWHDTVSGLARSGYRVIAPDWLGYGRTDKLVDFADPKGRRLRHMAAFIDQLGLESPALVGNSMGGSLLVEDLASEHPVFSASVAVLASAGGFVPFNETREILQEYDLTEASMAKILRATCYSDKWASDSDYVRWRYELSMVPGAWQAVASARVRPPGAVAPTSFGQPDTVHYESVAVPTLVIAGANDPLRLPGYAQAFIHRLPDAELMVYDECGHLPNIEHAERFVSDVVHFLDWRYRDPTREAGSLE